MIWGVATLLAALLAFVVVIVRRRRLSTGQVLQLIGQVPASPVDPGTQWLYGGRFEPPDPDPRKAPAAYVDKRPDPSLPAGIKRTGDPD